MANGDSLTDEGLPLAEEGDPDPYRQKNLLVKQIGGQFSDVGTMRVPPMVLPRPPPNKLVAYHGSPHGFEQFDPSKMGTGEGGAAFGPGMPYLAGNPAVASGYRWPGQSRGAVYGQTPQDIANLAYNHASTAGVDDPHALAKQLLQTRIDSDSDPVVQGKYQNALDNYDNLVGRGGKSSAGYLYEVGVDAHPDEFIDWDKSLNDHPKKIQDAVNGEIAKLPISVTPTTGAGAIIQMEGQLGSQEAMRRLSAAGIKGARYLDQGSRAAGVGTHNYTIYDPKILTILKKNGIDVVRGNATMDEDQK